MKQRYRLWQRQGKVFYAFDRQTGKQISLVTQDKEEARRLLNAKNEAESNPLLNRQIARAYLAASDPAMLKRTWRTTLEALIRTKRGENAVRWSKVMKDKALRALLDLPLIDTRPEHFLSVLNAGKVSTNVYLRRIHNFALDMDWLLKSVIPKRQWPKVEYGERRAITAEEHAKIIQREGNPERRALSTLLASGWQPRRHFQPPG